MREQRSLFPGRDREIYTPPGGPPQVSRPSPEIYARMGQDNILSMLQAFYDEIARSTIRQMFAVDLDAAAERIGLYFVGLLGGPALYQERHGPPMLRKRHLPFSIDQEARSVWLACFDRVLDRAVADFRFPLEHLEGFRTFLRVFSAWMVNVAPDREQG
jgi:hemoglobin